MFLSKLNIINFKNYSEANIDFCSRINCFTGNNGSGKTNLLDAIYYLSFCKSFTNPIDSHNIKNDSDFFMIQGTYKNDSQDDQIYCAMKRNQRKVFKRNKKEYDRLADHVGLFPLVIISPSDSSLIIGGSEERRKFMDSVISQYDKDYLSALIAYNKALQQRNALLKTFAEKNFFDASALDIWDEQLINNGEVIYDSRKKLFNEFFPIFQKHYKFLSNENELVTIDYDSQLNHSDIRTMLEKALKKDRIVQHSTAGTHKDDLLFFIDDMPVKKFGSQGQQKTFLIALKLAQYEFTKNVKGFKPILIFDDIFDKLDRHRVKQLIKLVSETEFGQIFVSDTNNKRLLEIFSDIKIPVYLYNIKDGSVGEKNEINCD